MTETVPIGSPEPVAFVLRMKVSYFEELLNTSDFNDSVKAVLVAAFKRGTVFQIEAEDA